MAGYSISPLTGWSLKGPIPHEKSILVVIFPDTSDIVTLRYVFYADT